ncbi:hypothetical protein CHLRE_02g112650v5 [Chlamydomonas reinhardtii]|uniref:HIG1 domain-containing protein n=1 Tax=Chlamydomonas reinhardtii TaxID=3055 RepID=A0A2K3E357_CHLRE|nr:uncharacterized protein CHLRE_02g112650v5 [Chlamydomonas reinhardtii]PNW87193.1 hypothetical protein CHLRE_02g112650v5 [Chlamydomonas reinhardtii]
MLNEELLKRGADQRARDAEKPAVQLSREQVSKAYDILEEQRVGPYAIKYGTFGSIGAIAYTYLRGFYYLSQKNRDAWMGTFRSRVFIMGPVLAAYLTANNILQLPFKEQLEAQLQRRAICMYDIVTAKQTVKLAKELPLTAQM